MTTYDNLSLAELVGVCKAMRQDYAAQWGESELPENKHRGVNDADGVSVVLAPADAGVLGGRSHRKKQRAEIETRDGFWQELAQQRDVLMKPVEQPAPHSHYRRSVNWLMHPGNCDGDCGPRKIRWMCAQPAESHVGRNGRRLAEIYGVK